MPDFLEVLNKHYKSFTRSQKRIADYLAENMTEAAFCTLEEIAQKTGVSTTTIIRFSRACGYPGYTAMQKDIQANMQTKASLPERLSPQPFYSDNVMLSASFQNDIYNIQQTLTLQDDSTLQTAVSDISSAPSVYVLGMRSSFSLSYYMASRLSEIRTDVHLIQSVGMLYPEEIVSAKAGDVCIAYMFPRYSKLTTTILSWLKNEGVKIILFTSQNYAAVKGYADVILPCYITSLSYKNTYSAPMSLSNYIIAAITQNNFDKSQETLKKTESILKQGFYLGL